MTRQPTWGLLCAAGTLAIAAAGCTTRQTYNAMQAWQRNECNSLVEQTEHERCLARTTTNYEDYKRQTDGNRKE